MKTLKQLQDAIEELNAVCMKHGILLVGTCEAEGIYGEIVVMEASEWKNCGWYRVNEHLDRTITEYDNYSISGLGELPVVSSVETN